MNLQAYLAWQGIHRSVSGILHEKVGLRNRKAIELTTYENAIHCTTKIDVILF